MVKSTLYFFLLIILHIACDSHVLYQDKIDIPGDYWAYQDEISFDLPDLGDRSVMAYLNIEHTTDFSFQNIYIKLNDSDQEVLSIQLASNTGAWLGTCKRKKCMLSSSLYSGRIGVDIPQSIKITQHTRDSLLMGIKAIGITIRDE